MLKKLYIEPTSRCNFSCTMCFRNTWFDEEICDLSFELVEKILVGLPNTVDAIFFGGMGEPFAHKDILKMLKLSKEKGYITEVLTNGSMLSEEICKELIDIKLDRLWISLDTLEVGEVELKISESRKDMLLKGHPDPKKIINNIRKLNLLRYRKNSKMDLGIAFVVSESNVHQLKHIPLFIAKHMVNDVNVSNMYPSSLEDMKETLYQRTLSLSLGSDKFSRARPRVNISYMDFKNKNVEEGLTGMFENMNFNLSVGNIPVFRRSQYCRFIEEGMSFVRSDGNVAPCMALLHNGTTAILDTERKVYHYSFGNVNKNTLEEIWNSKEYQEFRNKVKKFDFSHCMICGNCGYPESNEEDCFGNEKPTCGACLWSEGFLSCP